MGTDDVSETEPDSVIVDEMDVVNEPVGVVERDADNEGETEADDVSSSEMVAVFADNDDVSDTDHVLDPTVRVEERVRGMEADRVVEGDGEGVVDCDGEAEADLDIIVKDGDADGAGVAEGDVEGVGSDE